MLARSRRYRALDRLGPLAHGSTDAVHCGVAAADDDDVFTLGIQRAVVEQRARHRPGPCELLAVRKSMAGKIVIKARTLALGARAACRRPSRSKQRRAFRASSARDRVAAHFEIHR